MGPRALRAVLAAALLLAVGASREAYDDGDSDPAPFMIVLEHENRWRCAASLVSIRTGVTTARCARGPPRPARTQPDDLWALAAALVGGRPPAPPSAAARRVTRVALAGAGRDPADAAFDMAVVELEAPFGGAALSRPIVMATDVGGCESATVCHAVRAEASPAGGRRRESMRVSNLSFAVERRCAARVPHWAASRLTQFCLAGDELCERDLGGGVVCGGKLCGVLSAVGGGGGCGGTLAAHAVARWRRFLHCAHTPRLCGRGACTELCTEKRLLAIPPHPQHQHYQQQLQHSLTSDMPSVGPTVSAAGPPGAVASVPSRPPRPPRPPPPTRTSPAAPFAVLDDEQAPSPRPAHEFDPNRADFRAGEYGDNAADYGGEDAPPAPASAPTEASTGAPAPADPAPPAPALRVAAEPPVPSAALELTLHVHVMLYASLILPCLSILL